MIKICDLQKKKADLQDAGTNKHRVKQYSGLIRKYKTWLDKANETIKNKLQQIFKAKFSHVKNARSRAKTWYKTHLVKLIKQSNGVKIAMKKKLASVIAHVKRYKALLPKIMQKKKASYLKFRKSIHNYRISKNS
jgi:hypothetical protein